MMDAQLWLVFDILLALLTLTLGWASMASPNLQRGVILFIAFGLLLALVWARLRAPDLAMAEAIIGAGMTGALLLAALRDQPKESMSKQADGHWVGWLSGLGSLLLAGGIAWAMSQVLMNGPLPSQAEAIALALPDSGVSNPVTAVLLNFRAYDTLLEMAVLLAAVLGIMALGPARPAYKPAGAVLAGLMSWLPALLVVTAGYLLWVGAHEPGGAFQAGAMLAAAAVLMRLSGNASAGLPCERWRNRLLAAGLIAFLGLGLLMMAQGDFLQYPEGMAGSLILIIETAATISIGVTLAVAFMGGRLPSTSEITLSSKETT